MCTACALYVLKLVNHDSEYESFVNMKRFDLPGNQFAEIQAIFKKIKRSESTRWNYKFFLCAY